MIYQHLFDQVKEKRIVRAGLIGSGQYGTAVITQARYIPLLEIPIVADVDPQAARLAYHRAGITDDEIALCDSHVDTMRAMESGKCVIVEDPMLLLNTPIDVIVEATGVSEAGARHAYEAIQHGVHVAMINKETDSVIGPILKHLADSAGVVYTPVDGDQHGLLIGLVLWARSLGLEVLSGGKARNAECIYDPEVRTVSCGRSTVTISGADGWSLNRIPDGEANRYISARREILSALPKTANSDLGEMTIAANATGLMPDTPALHLPVTRISEIPEVLCPVEEGGILQTRGAIEIVTCLRKTDEAGLGGGVFIVVSCENDYSRMILTTKGLIPNSRGSAAVIYRPYHLCGVETPISILSAALLNVPTGAATVQPHVDLVAKSTRQLKAGTILGGDHSPDIDASILPASPIADSNPLPLHLLDGVRLSRDVEANMLITQEMVNTPSDSLLWSLRRQQDAHFGLKVT
jgi:predicted homoserine dehydrogenase-like protein